MINSFVTILAAAAETASEADTQAYMTQSMVSYTILMVGMVILFYFFGIAPQRKKDKEQKAMRESLQIGDEVTTIGGIVGIIVRKGEDTVVIETGGDRSKIRVKTWAISENLTKHDAQDELGKKK